MSLANLPLPPQCPLTSNSILPLLLVLLRQLRRLLLQLFNRALRVLDIAAIRFHLSRTIAMSALSSNSQPRILPSRSFSNSDISPGQKSLRYSPNH